MRRLPYVLLGFGAAILTVLVGVPIWAISDIVVSTALAFFASFVITFLLIYLWHFLDNRSKNNG